MWGVRGRARESAADAPGKGRVVVAGGLGDEQGDRREREDSCWRVGGESGWTAGGARGGGARHGPGHTNRPVVQLPSPTCVQEKLLLLLPATLTRARSYTHTHTHTHTHR